MYNLFEEVGSRPFVRRRDYELANLYVSIVTALEEVGYIDYVKNQK